MRRVGYALACVAFLSLAGCAQLSSFLGREAPKDVVILAVEAGPDGVVGTTDDLYVVDPGPDGALHTDDDLVVRGQSKLEALVEKGQPAATAFGYGHLGILAQGIAGLLTQGFALFAGPRRRTDGTAA